MSKALIFVDGETVKVVFGSALKCAKLAEVDQPANKAFFDKIFSQFDVFVAVQTSPVGKEKLLEAKLTDLLPGIKETEFF